MEEMQIMAERLQLELQRLVFGAAAPHVSTEHGARLSLESAAAGRAADQLAARQNTPAGAPAIIIRGGGDGWVLTFGAAPAVKFAGLPLAAAAAEPARKWVNMMLGRARAIWTQWAEEHQCGAAMEFDADRLELKINGHACLGFTLTSVPN